MGCKSGIKKALKTAMKMVFNIGPRPVLLRSISHKWMSRHGPGFASGSFGRLLFPL